MEFQRKQQAILDLLEARQVDALLLRRISSFAWATCGAASYVNMAAEDGIASLLVTHSGHYLITNDIEAPRLEQEERLKEQGWEFHVHLWHEAPDIIGRLVGGLRLSADSPYPGAQDLSMDLARLRGRLGPEEADRFRLLGKSCAASMDTAIRAVRPGQSEQEIAALLMGETQRRGVQPIVALIATDARIFYFRHPLPTDKKLERYAMLVLCGRKWGLVCSLTRLVHFGRLPEEVQRKAEVVAHVDATFIAGTRPGRTLGEVLQEAIADYAAAGYANEWNLHHQGGLAGYEAREFIATPGNTELVSAGQAYAWNPSIAGTKSEDTILIGTQGNEILSGIDGWPMVTVEVAGQKIPRPAILEIT